jgi:glycosyltransferase involved in cell wall biosynthesis
MERLSLKGHSITVIDEEDDSLKKTKRTARLGVIGTTVLENYHRILSNARVRLVRPMTATLKLTVPIAHVSRLNEILRAIVHADVVILYSATAAGLETILSCKMMSVPVVYHCMDAMWPCDSKVLRPVLSFLEEFTCRSANHVITVSPSLSRYVRNFGVDTNKITYVPVGVDINRFSPSEDGKELRNAYGFQPSDKVVLYAGHLFDFCGLDQVLGRFHAVIDRIREARLLIVGDGPALSKLTELVSSLGLADYVKLTGRQPHSLMPQIIAASDLCINSFLRHPISTYTFPSKVVEYMAMGRPVLMTDLPGSKDVLHNVPGVFFASQEHFTEQLIELLRNDEILRKAGTEARRSVESQFSFEKVLERFEGILERAIRENG